MSVKSMRMVITSHATAPRVTARVSEAPVSLEHAAHNEVASRSLRTHFIDFDSGGLAARFDEQGVDGRGRCALFQSATRFGRGGRLGLLRREN